jgi:hypothetical protein
MTTPGATRPDPPSSSAGEAAQSVATTAKDEGRAVMDTARSETGRLVSEARTEMRKQGDEQARRMADRVRDVGEQLERAQRGEAPQGAVADVLGEVGSRTSQFADRLQSGGIDGVTRDVKQFARERPGMFLAGAFALGIVAGRTLRNADTRALAEAAKPSGGTATGNVGGASQYASPEYTPPATQTSAPASAPYAR